MCTCNYTVTLLASIRQVSVLYGIREARAKCKYKVVIISSERTLNAITIPILCMFSTIMFHGYGPAGKGTSKSRQSVWKSIEQDIKFPKSVTKADGRFRQWVYLSPMALIDRSTPHREKIHQKIGWFICSTTHFTICLVENKLHSHFQQVRKKYVECFPLVSERTCGGSETLLMVSIWSKSSNLVIYRFTFPPEGTMLSGLFRPVWGGNGCELFPSRAPDISVGRPHNVRLQIEAISNRECTHLWKWPDIKIDYSPPSDTSSENAFLDGRHACVPMQFLRCLRPYIDCLNETLHVLVRLCTSLEPLRGVGSSFVYVCGVLERIHMVTIWQASKQNNRGNNRFY